jgi:hypothetical protein
MPTEVIVLEVDPNKAVRGADQANRALETIWRNADKGQTSVERAMRAFERQTELMGKTGAARMAAMRQITERQFAGDPAAIERVTRSLSGMATMQQQVEKSTGSLASRMGDFVRNPLQALGAGVTSVVAGLGPLKIGLIAAAGGVVMLGKWLYTSSLQLGDWAEQQMHMAARTGLTVKEVGQFSAAAKLAGMDAGMFEMAVRGLSRVFTETSEEGKKGREALHELGVTIYDASGKLRPMGQLWIEMADAIGGIEDPMKRARVSQELFKRTGIEIVAMLPELRRNVEQLKKLDWGIDESKAEQLHEIGRRYELINMQVERAWRNVKMYAVAGTEQVLRKLWVGQLFGIPSPFEVPQERMAPPGWKTPVEVGGRVAAGGEAGVGLAIGRPALAAYLTGAGGIEATKQRAEAAKKEYEERLNAAKALYEGSMRLESARAQQEITGIEKARHEYERLNAIVERLEKAKREHEEIDRAIFELESATNVKEGAFMQQTQAAVERMRKFKLDAAQEEQFNLQVSRLATVEYTKESEVLTKEWQKLVVQGELWRRAIIDKEIEGGLEKQQRFAERFIDTARRIREMETGAERGAIERRGAAAVRMAGAQYGPGSERVAIEQSYGIRLNLAQELYDFEQSQALKEADVNKQLELRRRATLDYERMAEEASLDHMTELASLERRRFDSLKDSFEGLFDALLSRSRSILSAIGDIFKAAVLTPVKEAVSSWMAAMLMPLFGGRGGTSRGFSLAGLFGMGGTAAAQAGGFMPGYGGISPLPGPALGPAGTWMMYPGAPVGWNAAGTNTGLAMAPTWGAKLGGMVPAAAMMGGLTLGAYGMQRGGRSGELMTIGGGAALGYGMAGPMGMTGYGGAITGAAGGLAIAGLQRGGWSGLGMTTAGGALIGLQFGGPLGAAIGAGVGFVAGLVRMLFKGAQEKAREKIKALYGINIADKGILGQIVEMAKSGFGGNLDVAIRSPQIRDMIQLYGETVDQRGIGFPSRMQPLTFQQAGGRLYELPSYSGGVQLPALSASGASKTVNIFQFDGPATTALLRGEAVQVVQGNPRLVANANIRANSQNFGRRRQAAQMIAPELVTN